MFKGPIKVLVIIAKEDLRKHMLDIISRSPIVKMEPTMAVTFNEGANLATQDKFGVALVDLDLPDCAGLDALVRLREKAPRLPITILTNSLDESAMAKARQLGAQNHAIIGHFDEVSLPSFLLCAMERQTADEMNKTLKVVNSILRHDVLNNLTVIGGSLEIFKMKRDEKFLNSAINAVDRSVDLIKKMKEVENVISPKEMKKIDLRMVLEELVKKYSGSTTRFFLSGEGSVLADDALPSVFDNIIINALLHSNTDEVRIDITDRISEGICEVRIADKGIGIPDEIKAKIWQEGFKYGKSGQSGLGLFIVRKVVERYGGSVNVVDNIPKGTIFIVRLHRWEENK
ncbi:MAG: ATP-binding protein [Methanomassiliicoccales archaeon]